jgi:hypothetical protein
MFCSQPLRVNDKSGFTFARAVGEFRLYVHPDGLKQNWRLPNDANFRSTVKGADAVWLLPGTSYVNDAAWRDRVCTCRRRSVEGIELPNHPFFVATLFQPQMAALHGDGVHPIVRSLVQTVSNAGSDFR